MKNFSSLQGRKIFRSGGKEGGRDPSLFFYLLKLSALFRLKGKPNSETDRSDTIGAGQLSIG